jgi:hypothetical protein
MNIITAKQKAVNLMTYLDFMVVRNAMTFTMVAQILSRQVFKIDTG